MAGIADPAIQLPPPPPTAEESARAADRDRREALRFIDRMRNLRSLGVGLAFFSVAGVFYANHAGVLAWAALLFDGFAWPHVAWILARRSTDPYAAERRNLVADSASAGVWVVLMHFNLLPSALLVAMLSMDKICVGGWSFLARTASAQLLAALLTLLLYGLRFEPQTSLVQILLCLPFLTAYPIGVATLTFALASKVRRQNKLLAELNRVDPLTGLLNRGHWEEIVKTELRRHQRVGRPAALLMLDIDRFKPINDLQGHTAGDEVLRRIAALLRQGVRDIDSVGRYGGDEFGVLLPDADLQQALATAERIRQLVEASAFGDGGLRCSVSIGIGVATAALNSSQEWISQADTALYRAKTEGRNRVENAA